MRTLSLAILIVAAGALISSPSPLTRTADESTAVRSDRIRLRHHFVDVLAQLRAADVAHLTPAQRAARARAIQDLDEYRQGERFPHNHDVDDRRVPLFEDRHGTLCAMAYLIAESGHRELVDLVRDRFNTGTIFELAADPVLGPPLSMWLETHGMTASEAALVQPSYVPTNPTSNSCDSDRCVTTGYAVASATTGAVELTTIALNVGSSGSHTWTGALGIASGVFGTVLGVEYFDHERGALALGVTNAGVGVLSTVIGVAALLSGGDDSPDTFQPEPPALAPFFARDMNGNQRMGLRIAF